MPATECKKQDQSIILSALALITSFAILALKRMRVKQGLIVCFLLLAGCDDVPHDPDGTLEKVQSEKILHVGLIHNPPWVNVRSSPLTGREIELIQSFANFLGVTPKWRVVSMDEGVHLLEKGQLNLLAGGLRESTPYKKLGYTRPYLITKSAEDKESRHVLGIKRGENRFLSTLEIYLRSHARSGEKMS